MSDGTPLRKSRAPRARGLIAFSALIVLLLALVVAQQSFRDYGRAVASAHEDATRLARIQSEYVELTFLAVDLTLRRAVERQYFNELFGNNLPEYMLHNLRLWVKETPQIAALLLTDAEGDPIVAAHKPAYRGWLDYDRQSFMKEPLFHKLQSSDQNVFWVSLAASRAPGGGNLILVGRRVHNLDGSFGGIIAAVIDPAIFLNYFASVEASTQRFSALALRDGTVLAHTGEKTAAHSMLLGRMQERLDAAGAQGPVILSGTDDVAGQDQVFTAITLDSLPVAVAVVLEGKDFLAAWWHETAKYLVFLALFAIFAAVISYFAVVMARQIARAEESEAAAALASQAKSEFLANMSHELRTPLNAVIGFSEMLNSGYFGPLNPKQKERIQDINLCGSHLLQLITDILEFSKGEAGKLELAEEPVNVPVIIDETVRMMREKANRKQISLEIVAPDTLPQLLGDKRKIRQILINLISNAVKFTPEHGQVRVSAGMNEHGEMLLTVSDTGVGIAKEDIAKALSVFGQVHRSHSQEGTGLGLPLCKMFAELHGGRLSIGSAVGEGTVIRIAFPAKRVLRSSSTAAESRVVTIPSARRNS